MKCEGAPPIREPLKTPVVLSTQSTVWVVPVAPGTTRTAVCPAEQALEGVKPVVGEIVNGGATTRSLSEVEPNNRLSRSVKLALIFWFHSVEL